jgi:hypothetical protein
LNYSASTQPPSLEVSDCQKLYLDHQFYQAFSPYIQSALFAVFHIDLSAISKFCLISVYHCDFSPWSAILSALLLNINFIATL